ncbi:MAG TPA: HAMP domain-containing sensor histidine kinase [Gammaproteobacteria bacterium]
MNTERHRDVGSKALQPWRRTVSGARLADADASLAAVARTFAGRNARRLAREGSPGSRADSVQAGPSEAAAEARLDEFLATLAHELRGPLASLHASTELLALLLPPDAAKLREVEARIRRQLAHLTRLVDDLRDVPSILAGEIVVERSRVDLRDVVDRALETCAPSMNARRHLLVHTRPESALWVDGDDVRLAQILINLLTNAAKFTPPGGRIEVRVERSGDDAVITVADDGIGIDAATLPRLFDRFIQAGATIDGGMGLGLPLVRRLAELHGGTVTAKSEGIGRGSEFVVRLPLARET